MPLEVPADPDALAYADLETAAELAESRVGGDAWLALAEPQQVAALRTASREIDALEDDPGFLGERADDEQLLAWPRTDAGYSSDMWPEKLVHATIELAISYAPALADGYSGPDVLSGQQSNGNIKSETIGPISMTYFDPAEKSATGLERFPAMVQRLLSGLLWSASGAWGSATVERAS